MEVINKNRKAYFEYEILEKLTAGIQLVGSEVKSIRNGDVSINEAFCLIINGEAFIRNMHVAEFKQSGTHQNHEPRRQRKLLLKRKEIDKLLGQVAQKGLAIKPLAVMLDERGMIKLEIGLGKGKKLRDKRQSIKEKDLKREQERNID